MAHGQIFARFAVRNGATRLVEHRQNAPLKIARVFESPTRRGGLEICVMDASPGLLAGDQHQYQWILEAGAQVRITVQGATRIHPAQEGLLAENNAVGNLGALPVLSTQTISAHVAAGACLELWPEAMIPFRDAAFSAQTEVWLEEGAQFTLFECLSAGRIARGEVFEFERVSLKTRASDRHGPLFCAQNRFVPAELNPRGRFCFGNATHWATLVSLGANRDTRAVRIAQEIIEVQALYGAASLLTRGGIAVSLLAPRAHDARCVALAVEKIWREGDVSRETSQNFTLL